MSDATTLQQRIETAFSATSSTPSADALPAFLELRAALEAGQVRAAEPDPTTPLGWRVNAWVKRGILLGFRLGELQGMPALESSSAFRSAPSGSMEPSFSSPSSSSGGPAFGSASDGSAGPAPGSAPGDVARQKSSSAPSSNAGTAFGSAQGGGACLSSSLPSDGSASPSAADTNSDSDFPYVFPYVDKHTYPARTWRPEDRVRVVPGGSSIRAGAYLAPGVVCMPPMYVNVGAHIGAGTMIDSHALAGSCAQIGERVHLSAAAQIGGVLEPVNATPVILEDDVLVGGNCGVYEGTLVRKGAVLAAGTILTRGTPVYDLVTGAIHRATADQPLIIPPNAVVVPGSRAITRGKATDWGLSLYTPVIVKYRDEKTDLSAALEELLR